MDADKDIYQFHPERTHQGLALVIANFTEGEDKREGAEADLRYMKKTFKRLGFKVDCHENVKGSELVSILNKCHYAFRNKTDGSYMLQLLYKCVEKYYANGGLAQNQTNFLDVLRDVTTQMSEMEFMGSKEYTIVPCIVHKLRKDVIFTQVKNMDKTKFTIKLSEIISTFGMSFFTWSNKN